MRKKLVAANWKMNGSKALVQSLAEGLKAGLPSLENDVNIAIIPPALYIADVQRELAETQCGFGVQNIARWEQGAYTGEISSAMAADSGCGFALVGHSERRQLFGETDEAVADKVRQAMCHGLVAIVCVGETLEERNSGSANAVVAQQLQGCLQGVDGAQWKNIVVAYEPVWAIGTGKTATAKDAQAMHKHMRQLLAELGAPAEDITLLYGGSVKPDNAAELFAEPDIDGGLIGGASLNSDDFISICKSL
ncbi:triose-phosphate isomerase [Marinobacter caseinilyticus]|uniref:triose-phosphate isomerase n=1 Tax=Marinobacter caseinilyticus TaxID=2692195 RepID=UPI00140C0BE3|nr:triose-phosphate isomerase [Marinobacter caseinilyticus]